MSPLSSATGVASQGLAVLPVFSHDNIQSARAALRAYLDRLADALLAPTADTLPGLDLEDRLEQVARRDPSLADTLWRAVCSDAQRDPRIAALASDPRLLALAEQAAGGPVAPPTVRVRANIPALAHRRQDWHTDVAVLDGTPCATLCLTCWVPLVDVGPGNGTLEVVLGARTGPPPQHKDERGRYRLDPGALDGPRHLVHAPAGSVVMMSPYAPHRAIPNTSGQARWSVAMWFKPAWQAAPAAS